MQSGHFTTYVGIPLFRATLMPLFGVGGDAVYVPVFALCKAGVCLFFATMACLYWAIWLFFV